MYINIYVCMKENAVIIIQQQKIKIFDSYLTFLACLYKSDRLSQTIETNGRLFMDTFIYKASRLF